MSQTIRRAGFAVFMSASWLIACGGLLGVDFDDAKPYGSVDATGGFTASGGSASVGAGTSTGALPGACENDCGKLPHVDGTKMTCAGNTCVIGGCRENWADCNATIADGCETNLGTGENCGACGNKCPEATPLCAYAHGVHTCVATCSGDAPSLCGASCVDQTKDPDHCGSCLPCEQVNHATQFCGRDECEDELEPLRCQFKCDPGYEYYYDCVPHTPGTWAKAEVHKSANAVWGSGPNDVYVAGQEGMIVHSTGDGQWTRQTPCTGGIVRHFGDLWGSGPNDIYAISSDEVWHSTGDGTWTMQTVTEDYVTFQSIWGSGPNDVYLIGSKMWHSTGDGTWTEVALGGDYARLHDIWGSGPDDIYVLADSSTILHRGAPGSLWTAQKYDTALSVCGTGKDNVFVLTGSTNAYHSPGNQIWTAITLESDLTDCFALDQENLFFVDGNEGLVHYTRSNGQFAPLNMLDTERAKVDSYQFRRLWASSADEVYAAAGLIYRYY